MKNEPTRRQFLKASIAGIAGISLANDAHSSDKPKSNSDLTEVNGIPYRSFGKTGEQVSLLAVGGYHIGRPTETEGIRIIQEAISEGVNFLDNAYLLNKSRCDRQWVRLLCHPAQTE